MDVAAQDRSKAHKELFAACDLVDEREGPRLRRLSAAKLADAYRLAVQAELGPDWMVRWAGVEAAHWGAVSEQLGF